MKRSIGPTKKLAPSLSPNASCPHTYSDDEGIQLEIDCLECAGAHDLKNSKCLTGVLNVVSSGAEPEAIILKRFIHKRYRGEVVRRIASAASELAALNRAMVSAEPPSDKRCRTCAASSERVVSAMKLRLLENPLESAASRLAMLEDIERAALALPCESARACVEKGLRIRNLGRG